MSSSEVSAVSEAAKDAEGEPDSRGGSVADGRCVGVAVGVRVGEERAERRAQTELDLGRPGVGIAAAGELFDGEHLCVVRGALG